MFLTIIVPCLDEAPGIAEMLRALASLRERGAEVIVVDGGSSDASAALARPFADDVITAPRGRARQMNAGARMARGDVLLFLHADCRLPLNADALVRRALADPRKAWGRFDIHIESKGRLLRLVARAMNLRSRWTAIATGDQGIFVRRSVFEALGGYADIGLMEDIELCTRLKRYAAPVCVKEKIIASGRRWEKHGIVRTILLMWSLRFAHWLGVDPQRLASIYAPHRHRE